MRRNDGRGSALPSGTRASRCRRNEFPEMSDPPFADLDCASGLEPGSCMEPRSRAGSGHQRDGDGVERREGADAAHSDFATSACGRAAHRIQTTRAGRERTGRAGTTASVSRCRHNDLPETSDASFADLDCASRLVGGSGVHRTRLGVKWRPGRSPQGREFREHRFRGVCARRARANALGSASPFSRGRESDSWRTRATLGGAVGDSSAREVYSAYGRFETPRPRVFRVSGRLVGGLVATTCFPVLYSRNEIYFRAATLYDFAVCSPPPLSHTTPLHPPIQPHCPACAQYNSTVLPESLILAAVVSLACTASTRSRALPRAADARVE